MNKNKIFTEILGTFFLTLVAALTGSPFAIGAVLVALVYSGGHISGAHYNPAVSIAQFISKRINSKELVFYCLSQIVGAVLASVSFALIIGSPFTLTPNPQASTAQVFASELVFTFLLAFVVLAVSAKAVKNNQYFGISIGLVIMAGVFSVGGISGAALNPAITLSAVAVDTANIQSAINILGLFLSAQLIGGIVAGIATRIQQK